MICPNCGKEQPDNATYCSNCGAMIVREPTAQPGTAYTGTAASASAAEYAGFWRRFGAYILDVIVLNVAGLIIGFIIGLAFASAGADESTVMGISSVIIIILAWLYFAISESSSKQATLGKLALGVVVTDGTGNRVSFGRATGRFVAKIISGLILCIGYLMIAFTERKQGLHDMIADTLVVLK